MLKWVLERVTGAGDATETAIGYVPTDSALDTDGLEIDPTTLAQLLAVDNDAWRGEVDLISGHFEFIGEQLPQAMKDELAKLEKRLAG